LVSPSTLETESGAGSGRAIGNPVDGGTGE